MFSKQTKKQYRGKGKKQPRRGNVVGGTSAQYNHLYQEKSKFPILPREFECALDYYYHDERTGGQTTQAARLAPLCEFNTQLPRFASELYQIYRHARIMAIDVHMEIVNTSSTEPLIAAVGCLPLVNCNAITNPQTIVSVPGSVLKQVGLSTGLSKVTINKRFVTDRMLGELTIGSNTYLQTYSEALSSAIWTELPCIYMGVIAAKNGATWTGIIDYKLRFHIRWSEYSIPSLGLGSLMKKAIPIRTEEPEMDEDVEWVQPQPVMTKKKGNGSLNSSRTAR